MQTSVCGILRRWLWKSKLTHRQATHLFDRGERASAQSARKHFHINSKRRLQ